MTIADYCHKNGMTLEMYKQYEQNILATADAVKANMIAAHKPDTGVYYDLLEVLPLVPGLTIIEQRNFIIQALKRIGIEFFSDNTLYRV